MAEEIVGEGICCADGTCLDCIETIRHRSYKTICSLEYKLKTAKQTINILNKTIYDLNIELSYKENKMQSLYKHVDRLTHTISDQKILIDRLQFENTSNDSNTGHVSYQQLNDSFVHACKERDNYKHTARTLEDNNNYWKEKCNAIYSAVNKIYEE